MSHRSGHDVDFSEASVLVRCWTDVLGTWKRPWPLLCLAPWFLAELAWTLALARFPLPPFDVWFAPLFEMVGGEQALHYPGAYAELPFVQRCGGMILAFVVGTWSVTALASALPSAFARRRGSVASALGLALRALPLVWIATLPRLLFLGLAVAINLRGGVEGSALDAFVPAASLGVVLLVDLAWSYVVMGVVLGGCGPAESIARSISLAGRFPWSTAGLVLVPRFVTLPFLMVELDMYEYIGKIPPEAVNWIVSARVVCAMIAAYVEVAGRTRLYLHAHGAEEAEA